MQATDRLVILNANASDPVPLRKWPLENYIALARSLVTLYTLSSLMITSDSGPSHFADLTTMPAITLFGPETPEIYGPLGVAKIAIASTLACSPCVSSHNHRHSPCDNNICMKAITVEHVWEVCQSLLANTTERSVAQLLDAGADSGIETEERLFTAKAGDK